MLKVSKTLIIYEIPAELTTKIEVGDILFKFNDLQLQDRAEYIKQLSMVAKIASSQTLTFTILRPIRNTPIAEVDLPTVFSKLQQPQGFEILPGHCDYFVAVLTVAPKASLGMRIKCFNGKIYVCHIKSGVSSVAYKSLLVGDAILAIEDKALGCIKDANDLLRSYFEKGRFVSFFTFVSP